MTQNIVWAFSVHVILKALIEWHEFFSWNSLNFIYNAMCSIFLEMIFSKVSSSEKMLEERPNFVTKPLKPDHKKPLIGLSQSDH